MLSEPANQTYTCIHPEWVASRADLPSVRDGARKSPLNLFSYLCHEPEFVFGGVLACFLHEVEKHFCSIE